MTAAVLTLTFALFAGQLALVVRSLRQARAGRAERLIRRGCADAPAPHGGPGRAPYPAAPIPPAPTAGRVFGQLVAFAGPGGAGPVALLMVPGQGLAWVPRQAPDRPGAWLALRRARRAGKHAWRRAL
jgi:hypothetical protein